MDYTLNISLRVYLSNSKPRNWLSPLLFVINTVIDSRYARLCLLSDVITTWEL